MTKELREKLTLAINECYSKEGSACPLHTVFHPQMFLSLLPGILAEAVEKVGLTPEEMTAINDAMPPEARYGDVFAAIAKAQLQKVLKAIKGE